MLRRPGWSGSPWRCVPLPLLAIALLLQLVACDSCERRKLQTQRFERAVAMHKELYAKIRADPQFYFNRLRTLLIEPDADCMISDRVGAAGDGGKWLCNSHRIKRPCMVYGVGAGEEIDFDEQMARDYGCEVHVFDPAPKAKELWTKYEQTTTLGQGTITFHPWGLGPVADDPARARDLVISGQKCEVKTLGEMVEQLGHKKIDILKMDIEGSEWSTFDDILKNDLLKKLGIKQLQVEFHVYDAKTLARLTTLTETLRDAGYWLFRTELNPGRDCCVEFAFAERSFLLD